MYEDEAKGTEDVVVPKSLMSKFSNVKVPHAFVLISFMIILAWIATYVLPAGKFARETIMVKDTMRSVLIPGTYKTVASSPADFMDLASAFYLGLQKAAEVVFLIFFAYSCFNMVLLTGALNTFIHRLLKMMRGAEWLFIVVFSYLFSLGGSVAGMGSEFYGFMPLFISLAIAMGYDAMVGFAVVNMTASVGFAAGTSNPFTVQVAQAICQLPLLSGIEYRYIWWFIFTTLNVAYILWYALRVKKDPSKSLLADIPREEGGSYEIKEEIVHKVTIRDTLIILTVVIAMVFLVIGATSWGWGMKEIVGTFTVMAVVSTVIAGWHPDRIAEEFIDGCRGIVYGALITGLARGILIILDKGNITDTIMYHAANLFDGMSPWFAAQAMFFVQAGINFLIPSGSGQAATTMPIMAGLSDLLGVSRQVAVLAFQFGDGFFNLIWPTSGIVVACALAKVPMGRWLKFYMPFFGVLVVGVMICLTVAMEIGL